MTLGRFKLGDLIRFIPYPVIGGFLAGTGWLLVRGSIGVMAGVPLSFSQLPFLFQADVLVSWLPGLIFAILLLVILNRYNHFLILPGMLLGSIVLFYAILWLTNTSAGEAGSQGWLLGPFPGGGLWQPLTFSDLAQVNWSVIFGQVGNVATILIVSVVSLLLNASGLELAVKQDIDLNRELQAAGVANLASGLGGSMVGFHTLSLSALGHKMGATSRLMGLIASGVCGATLFLGASVLSFFPKPVLGGLLMFLGLAFLYEWVYITWFKLSKADYFIVLLILVVIGWVGFLEGVGVGVVAAVALFVVNYSHINVVKNTLSGANYQSNFDRSAQHRRLLREKGDQIYILKLQGFIFFGTANNLLIQVHQRASDPDLIPLRYAVLDFRQVSGLDSSALHSFAKMRQLAEGQNIIIVFTHLSPKMRLQLEKEGFAEVHDVVFRIFPDLDHGIEWCENQILAAENMQPSGEQQPLQKQLESLFPNSAIVARLMDYFEKEDVGPGYHLMRQGDLAEELYFIESGLATAQLELKGGKIVRLRTMGHGTIVGEVGMYLGDSRSASVVTDEPSTLYRLSASALQQMKKKDSDVATEFQEFIIRLLAERLAGNSRIIQALLD